MEQYKKFLFFLVFFGTVVGCTKESSRSIDIPTITPTEIIPNKKPIAIVIGQFDSRSSLSRGVFSSGENRLGNQAKTILTTHLQQTGQFSVMDRENIIEAQIESSINNQSQDLMGGHYIVTGDVVEFGRKDIGNTQLFGLLGRGKSQVAYSKVALNIVDVRTSEIVFSVMGAGEYSLSTQEFIGFGSNSGYDSTLNGKVLDLAIRQAVNELVEGIHSDTWQVYSTDTEIFIENTNRWIDV
jgi:curli biogenesis system outer membrane secretion channel CsgG